jgi:hypothetical protein
MKAITSKFIPCSNVRGSRYQATDGDGCTVYVQAESHWTVDQSHAEAVRKLCERREWHGTLAQGYLMKRGHDHCRVWVWVDFGQNHNEPDMIAV